MKLVPWDLFEETVADSEEGKDYIFYKILQIVKEGNIRKVLLFLLVHLLIILLNQMLMT